MARLIELNGSDLDQEDQAIQKMVFWLENATLIMPTSFQTDQPDRYLLDVNGIVYYLTKSGYTKLEQIMLSYAQLVL
jgi:hypothetical protein